MLFQSLGVQLAAIWALLSAGGIGIGLAKDPAQELFAYLMILLDNRSPLVNSSTLVQPGQPWNALVFAPPICAVSVEKSW